MRDRGYARAQDRAGGRRRTITIRSVFIPGLRKIRDNGTENGNPI